MNSTKYLFLMVIASVFVISVGTHPGPERHPVEQELTALGAELRSHIDSLERRLNARIDGLVEPDAEAISIIVENSVSEALVGVTQTVEELENQMEEVGANSRLLPYYGVGVLVVLLAGFIGMFAYMKNKLKD